MRVFDFVTNTLFVSLQNFSIVDSGAAYILFVLLQIYYLL